MRLVFFCRESLSGKKTMPSFRGKSIKAFTQDIAEGYALVNALFLKPFNSEEIKDLYKEISKTQIELRGEKFPVNDIPAIRERNLRLQRLFSAIMIIRNFSKERKISLA